MGVKRMETRLITEYVNERMNNIRLQQKILSEKSIHNAADDLKAESLQGRLNELSNLYDILGGYNE